MEPHGFLQQALVYLAAGVIAVPLCKRLGLGSVLGYLVAGMAIGPWGLRLIADPQTVLQFSEFGVVLLLFLIGLELNPQRVWALRRTIFGLGGVQVVATIAAVAGIGVALGLPLAVSAIAGMGFAMSSTAIGLATLTEKNLLPTPGGQASFAVLLFQDLAVIPLLLVVGLVGGEAEMLKWADAAKALGMIVLLKAVILFPIAQAFGYCERADAGLFAVALSQAGEFAFVLFGAASTVLPAPVAAILNAAVAVSMLTTPFFVMGYERFLMRRLDRPVERAPDAIRETNPVIVAGFGRFGQVVVRVLRALGIGATVIDHDPGQIDTVRRFGWKAYYGDATRLDLLESAGAARARLLLVAIDDPEAAMQIVKRVRSRFPELALVVRAHSRTDAYEYTEMGVPAGREGFGPGP